MTDHEPKHLADNSSDAGLLIREVIQTLLLALVLALLIRTFLVETYLVYGPSMEPSLNEGERLLVNKLVYRLRSPAPGEIIVFREPGNDGRNLVKRVVAVAGQEIEIRNGDIIVDGGLVRENYVISPSSDSMPPLIVPEGQYYVMGDNRSNSLDSRYFGPIPAANVRGRAFVVFWPPNRMNLLAIFHGWLLGWFCPSSCAAHVGPY